MFDINMQTINHASRIHTKKGTWATIWTIKFQTILLGPFTLNQTNMTSQWLIHTWVLTTVMLHSD